MFSIIKIRSPFIMGILPFVSSSNQYDIPRTMIPKPPTTPMERIRNLFASTEYAPISKEMQRLINFTGVASIVGAFVGGIFQIQGSVQKFIDNNEATRFYSAHDARRELQYKVTIQFAKGAFKYGWRIALFSAIYESTHILLTTYYGHPSVWHYLAGGGTAGFLFKMSLGVRGALVGLTVGSVLGGISGFLNLFLLSSAGLTMDHAYRIQQDWNLSRKQLYKKNMVAGNKDSEEAMALYNECKAMEQSLEKEEVKEENKVKKL